MSGVFGCSIFLSIDIRCPTCEPTNNLLREISLTDCTGVAARVLVGVQRVWGPRVHVVSACRRRDCVQPVQICPEAGNTAVCRLHE